MFNKTVKIAGAFCILVGLAIFLNLEFSGRLILSQDFHIGFLVVHYYGLIMALAVAAGFFLAASRVQKFGIEPKQAEDMLFWTIVGGFLGARVYHVLSSAGYYWAHPIDVFKVYNGGLSIYGAVLGGILTLWIYKKLPTTHYTLLTLLDWLAPAVLLGQIIGRFGNLFNYEAFGYPTDLPWKMFVPVSFRPVEYVSQNFFHPWFLYEAVGNILILIFLLKIGKPKARGMVVFLYLLLYNSLRFCLEFLRIDSTFILGFRLNAAVSLVLVVLSLAGLWYANRHPQTS